MFKIKEIKNNNKSSFYWSIINFIVGSLLFYDALFRPINVILLTLLLSYLPFILFFIITLLSYYLKDNLKMIKIIKIITKILTYLQFFYYFIAIFMIAILMSINPVTNPKYYNFFVYSNELNKIFPKKIPDNVKDIHFYYAPGILQGSTNYVLYYVDENMTSNNFNDTFEEKAIWIGYENDYTEKNGLLASAFYYTPIEYKNQNDFIIYLIDGSCDKSGYCNHGKYLFVAINENTNEIIYKLSLW